MSKKVKRQVSSMSFSISRWLSRVSNAKPSTFIVSILIIGVAIFLFGGGIYTVIKHQDDPPNPLYYYDGQNLHFIFTSEFSQDAPSQQFGSETLISSIFFAMGLIGLLSVYRSTKQAYNPRQAHMTFILGTAILFLAYLFLEIVIGMKI